jgi:hypothetical protein
MKYLDFFLLMAKACCNMTKTDQKDNIIASNLLSLASSDWIVADIYLIAGVAKSWLNPHMRWYQGSDRHIGTPWFLCFHRQVRYFLMLEDLKKIEESWREMDEFAAFSKKLLTMTNLIQRNQIVDWLDIWEESNTTNKNAHLLCSQALRSFAAHASTQQDNKRLVKPGALMSSTGKSEIMTSIFAIASNGFMTEHHDEDTHLEEVPANQPAVAKDKDEPKRRRRGNYRGRKKLLDLEHETNKKSNQLAAIATKLGAQAYDTRIKAIGTCLKSKADNLLERSSDTKVRTMMATFDKPGKQASARQRKRGKDMPPRLLGYFPYVPVGRTINMSELDKELRTRNVAFELTLKVTKKCDLLKQDKARRKEEQVYADLTARGYKFNGLKLAAKLQLIRQDIMEKEETTNDEYEVDMTKYFKLLSSDVDESIFEEE